MPTAGRRKYLIDYTFGFVVTLTTAVRPLVFVPLLIKTMGKDAYGIWSQVLVTAMLLEPLLTLKMPPVLTRFLTGATDIRRLSAAFLAALLLPTTTGALLLAFATMFQGDISQLAFGDRRYADHVMPMVWYCVSHGVAWVCMSQFLVMNRQRVFAVWNVLFLLLEIAVAGALLTTGSTLPTTILWVAITRFAAAGGIAAWILHKHGLAPPRLPGGREIWTFAAWLLIGQLLTFWGGRGTQYILVGLTKDIGAVAQLSIVATLAHVVSMVGSANESALLPTVSAHWNAGRQDLAQPLMRLAYKILLLASLPMVVGLYFYGNAAIAILANRDLAVSRWLVPLFALGCVGQALAIISQFAMWMQKRLHLCIIIQAAGAVTNVVLAVVLIPLLGIAGAVIAASAALLLMAAWSYRLSLPVFGVGIDWSHARRCLVSATIMALVLWGYSYVALPKWLSVTTGVLLGTVVYGLAALALGAVPIAHIRQAISMVKSRIAPAAEDTARLEEEGFKP